MARALITGPTAGIGAGFARRLAKDGYSVVLVARDKARLEALSAELSSAHGVEAEVLVADLATEAGIAACEKRLGDEGSPVDLVINNAGFGQLGTYLNVPVADEQRMLKVHIEAVLRLTSAALPGMIARRSGQIINVASVAAFLTRGTYGASKAWVVSFTRGVANDVGAAGIQMQALCPGFVRTEFHERAQMDTSAINSRLWLTVEEVVDESLEALKKNKTVVITGRRYRAMVAVSKLIPSSVVAKISTRSGRKYD